MFATPSLMSNSVCGGHQCAARRGRHLPPPPPGAMGCCGSGVSLVPVAFGADLAPFSHPRTAQRRVVCALAAFASTMIFIIPRRTVLVSEERSKGRRRWRDC